MVPSIGTITFVASRQSLPTRDLAGKKIWFPKKLCAPIRTRDTLNEVCE